MSSPNPNMSRNKIFPLLLLVITTLLTSSCRSRRDLVVARPFTPVYAMKSSATAYEQPRPQTVTISFNDGQSVQIVAARNWGVSPMRNAAQLQALTRLGRLTPISTCSLYQIDRLTHSYPYLVPRASDLLSDIARRVQQLVGGNCRIIVTSVLRTEETVAQLQKSNGNAVSKSCHLYGTTFDISSSRFVHPASVTDATVHAALRQALFELRRDGRCYVKQEYNQACYHITVR